MSWTTPVDLRAQVQNMWDKGLLQASLVNREDLFPRRLTLRRPAPAELSERFNDVRTWIACLQQGAHYRVVMREVRNKIIGSNAIPDEIWIDTIDDAFAFIEKNREAGRFKLLVESTVKRRPALLPWLAKHPLKALNLADDWHLLLDVIDWMETHPRPGIYLRQMDVPCVHTKFIEARRPVLSELLDLALFADAASAGASGPGQFCRRYGFLEKPLRIRFRILDPAVSLLPADTDQDIAINQDAFNRIKLKAGQVFITENEINFLAFPKLPDSMVIFGAGYGLEMLAQAEWLQEREVYYWGDIDTHGFAILDQLRQYLPKARSFLMDRETLMAHKTLWGKEPMQARRDLPRLTSEERALFTDLRDNRIGRFVRLEQEKIGFAWVQAALNKRNNNT